MSPAMENIVGISLALATMVAIFVVALLVAGD